ncbi:MAG: DUF4058 family protein [Planctomycetota bacterium]|nr:DUF4058 family protein [Planctomycetota bacterium]
MPVHDWTRVSAGTFHSFHLTWIVEVKKALNREILPDGFYAQSEQVPGNIGLNALALNTTVERPETTSDHSFMTAVAEAPPEVSFTETLDEVDYYTLKRRTLFIRHASGDQIVAIIEIPSIGNKNRTNALEQFLDKAVSALSSGFHLLLIDLHPPGKLDPQGIHAALWDQISCRPFQQPQDRPLTLAAYTGGMMPKAYVEPITVGTELPDMPLFLEQDWYVNVPLEQTYSEAYASVPLRWRTVIEDSAV